MFHPVHRISECHVTVEVETLSMLMLLCVTTATFISPTLPPPAEQDIEHVMGADGKQLIPLIWKQASIN